MQTPLLFWWDNTIIYIRPDGSMDPVAATAEPLASIVEHIKGLSPAPETIRVIYHSDKFDVSPESLPKIKSRSQLKAVLSLNHAAVGQPNSIFGIDRLIANGPQFMAMLYTQPSSPLLRLEDDLRDINCRIEGAWSISSIVEQWSQIHGKDDMSGVVGFFAGEFHSFFYRRTPHGDRAARVMMDADDIMRSMSEVAQTWDNNTQVRYVQFGSDRIIDAADAELPTAKKVLLPWSEVLELVNMLPINSIANLLPHGFQLTRKQTSTATYVAAAIVALGALAFGAHAGIKRHAFANAQAEAARLEMEVKSTTTELQQNKSQIEAIQAFMAAAEPKAFSTYAFIERLKSAQLPKTILIHSLIVDDRTFTITGINLGDGSSYDHFIQGLFTNADPWQLDADASSRAPQNAAPVAPSGWFTPNTPKPVQQPVTGDFTIHGGIRSI